MNKYLLCLCMLTLAACSANNEDLQEWMRNTSQQAKSKPIQTEQAQINTQPAYTPPAPPPLNIFDPARLRAGLQGDNAPDLNRPKQILENYPLNQLFYVGLIQAAGKAPSALISADEHIYTVNIGNYLGENFGRITSITPDEIVISELVEDSSGKWISRPASLPLQAADSSSAKTSSQTLKK
ncbi:hypothetical protein BHC47_03060 [Snodgrassella alvi]|uniref:Pilus assembly protein PilP n=1 Tax=Snodgrassella alvi TaxID=1196083 RepID=A0A2N9Y5U0_9NEIS|nr:pilus assembly protein PilP [Snodgrassella alvi]PIT63965.1 hypothetical protein BHC47_03060 [Snodgrassella alvi]PIT66833.1 hypothetical protein BHC56_02820 [Snodgrassella alvi]